MRRLAGLIATLAVYVSACSGAGDNSLAPPRTLQSHGNRHAPSTTLSTIPFWESAFTYGGTTYTYKMVGTSPFAPAATTTIASQIIPLSITFSNGKNFNIGSDASLLAASPIYTNASYGTVGTTQYGDAVMRSEFGKVAGTSYHVLMAPPTIEPTIAVSIPSQYGYTTTSNGTTTGYIEFAYFMNVVETGAIQKLNISPTTLSIFPTVGVKLLEPGPPANYCCYNGYHYDLTIATQTGTGIFTTVWGPVASYKSIETLSHEVAEWLNDPFYSNVVPPWIQPGTSFCGGGDLEVGDPVTNYDFTANGYIVQDVAFYSWFSRDVPSLGVVPSSGMAGYDLLGKLSAPASDCHRSPSPSPSPTSSPSPIPSPSPAPSPKPSPTPSPSRKPSPTPSPSPKPSPTPSPSPTPKLIGRVDVDPHYIVFTHVGSAFKKKVLVSQQHFGTNFARRGDCEGTVSVKRIASVKGSAVYEVVPLRSGRCSTKFVGGTPAGGTLSILISPR